MKSIQQQIPISEKRWYAVQCKFRCEKNLFEDLSREGINVYLPIIRKVRQYSSRKKKSIVPLIPSHIFVKIDRSSYKGILRHRHVYRFLHFSGTLSQISEMEMDIMKRVVGECDEISIHDGQYNLGDRIQIISGELTGLVGVLIETNNHNFKIELMSLGLGLMIYVDPKNLLKIGSMEKVT